MSCKAHKNLETWARPGLDMVVFPGRLLQSPFPSADLSLLWREILEREGWASQCGPQLLTLGSSRTGRPPVQENVPFNGLVFATRA